MDFDAITATQKDWTDFFGIDRNLSKDFKNLTDYEATPCRRAFQHIAVSNLPETDRANILTAVVAALLEKWAELAHLVGIPATFRGLRHPVRDVLLLTQINGVLNPALLEIAQLLWEKLPKGENRQLLLEAFEQYSPISAEELIVLFYQDGRQYDTLVVSIFLDRGDIAQADSLFHSRLSEIYVDVDPGCLDWLVEKGLPVATARLWLDQSSNRTQADAGNKVAIKHCDDAITRWAKLAPPETDPP
ncbi:MAG: hypothetical protein RLZZ360_184 [Candidatus Parcubacteria bacterium]|jgi:hypothetical protein